MSALDFERAGVRFVITGGWDARVVGPEGQPELLESLRREVARRLEEHRRARILTGRRAGARSGECDACGDATPSHRGGHCALCVLALDRLRREKQQ